MRQFIIIFFCSLLALGNLQLPNYVNNYQVPAEVGTERTGEDQNWPIQTYNTFQGNFYGTAKSNINANPCVQHKNTHDMPTEHQTNNEAQDPIPRRRFLQSETVKGTVTKTEPINQQHETEVNNQKRPNTFKPVNKEEATNSLKSLPAISTAFGPTEASFLDELHNLVTPLTKHASYNVEIINSPHLETDEPSRHTNDECTNKKQLEEKITKSPRRFLITHNDYMLNQNNGARPNDNQQGLLAQSFNNQENLDNVLQNQNENNSAFKNENNPAGEQGKVERSGKLHLVLNPINDPTKGEGISPMKKTTLMLMDYDRVCYACSSANNPNCLSPSRRTSVKYCRKGDNACVVKTYTTGSTTTLIRDCGRSCNDPEVKGLAPPYKTCSICHEDLCNGAYTINVHSLILTLLATILIVLVKPLL